QGRGQKSRKVLLDTVAGNHSIVPIAVELPRLDREFAHDRVRDLEPGRVLSAVELGFYFETAGSAGVGDQIHDGFVVEEWSAAPILRDVRGVWTTLGSSGLHIHDVRDIGPRQSRSEWCESVTSLECT